MKLRPSQMTVDTIGSVQFRKYRYLSRRRKCVGENGTVVTPEEDGTYEMRYAVNWTVSGNPIHPTPGSSSQQTTPGGGKWKPTCGSSVAAMSKRKLSLKHRETIPKKALPGSGPAILDQNGRGVLL